MIPVITFLAIISAAMGGFIAGIRWKEKQDEEVNQ